MYSQNRLKTSNCPVSNTVCVLSPFFMVNAQVVWRLSSLEILVLTTHTDTGIRHSSKTEGKGGHGK